MRNIYISCQGRTDTLFYDGQLGENYNVVFESELDASKRVDRANGWANAYIMLDAKTSKENRIQYCGKETGKSFKLATDIANSIGDSEIIGGGEGWLEMNGTVMVSVLVELGSNAISIGVDTFFAKLKVALDNFFGDNKPVVTEPPVTEPEEPDDKDNGDDIKEDTNVEDKELVNAIKTILKYLRNK